MFWFCAMEEGLEGGALCICAFLRFLVEISLADLVLDKY